MTDKTTEINWMDEANRGIESFLDEMLSRATREYIPRVAEDYKLLVSFIRRLRDTIDKIAKNTTSHPYFWCEQCRAELCAETYPKSQTCSRCGKEGKGIERRLAERDKSYEALKAIAAEARAAEAALAGKDEDESDRWANVATLAELSIKEEP